MSTHIRNWLIVVSFAIIQAVAGDIAASFAQEPIPVKREILALYDGAQEGDADFTRIHRLAEMPLNHLGFILRFHDIRTKLPEPAEMERYRGVLTWFAGPVSEGNSYRVWATQVSQMNVRYVILGDVGIAINSANLPAVNQLLALAGVRHTGDYFAPTLGTRVAQKDQSLIEFECQLGPVLPDYPIIDTDEADTRIGLMLETPLRDGRRRTVLVGIGEKGAYAAWNFEFCHQRPPLYRGKWLINPFAFFHAAFGSGDEPIPDTTTVSGNRLYFSSLDNEGWTRSSKIDAFRDAAAGEVALRELIEPFQDLPTTIGLRQAELTRFRRSGKHTQMALQRLLDNPNVDVAQRGLQTTLSRFDSEYPSISNLSSLISAGPDRFINRPISDDAAYNNTSVVGEGGFNALKETVTNTGSPRRLKPFTINYHAYAGEYPALLRLIKDQLRIASLAALTPISVNRYAAIVDGFFSARVDRLGDASWRISNRGALQTVRFDAAEGRDVDFHASVGVIGQKRDGTTLYVALDEAIEPAVVALGPPPLLRIVSPGPALVESRWLVRRLEMDGCTMRFEAQGYGDGLFRWSDAAPGPTTITASRADQELWRQTVEPDSEGRLIFLAPISAVTPLNIRISCDHTARSVEQ